VCRIQCAVHMNCGCALLWRQFSERNPTCTSGKREWINLMAIPCFGVWGSPKNCAAALKSRCLGISPPLALAFQNSHISNPTRVSCPSTTLLRMVDSQTRSDSTIPQETAPPPPTGGWEELQGNWVLGPPFSDEPPWAVLHFLGGALVGASSQITPLMHVGEAGSKGHLIVAPPHQLSFDHLETCDEVTSKFELVAPDVAPQSGALPAQGMVRVGSQPGRDKACLVLPRIDASLSVRVSQTGGASADVCSTSGLRCFCRCNCHRLHSRKTCAACSTMMCEVQHRHRVVHLGPILPHSNICAVVATVLVRNLANHVSPVTMAGSL
jgi:hypothetical protein